jgi:hypothetical protein
MMSAPLADQIGSFKIPYLWGIWGLLEVSQVWRIIALQAYPIKGTNQEGNQGGRSTDKSNLYFV